MCSALLRPHTYRPQVLGGGEQSGSLGGLLLVQGCGFLGGALNQPGVGQDSLDGQSVHGVVLQQPGNQVFGSRTNSGLCRVSVLHLDDKIQKKKFKKKKLYKD